MPTAFAVSRVVDRPAAEVWRRLTDWDNAAGWLGVDSVGADGPTAVGTRSGCPPAARSDAARSPPWTPAAR